MDARLMWTHQSALERQGVVALARLGGHAFPCGRCDARAPALPAHRLSLLISLGMLISPYCKTFLSPELLAQQATMAEIPPQPPALGQRKGSRRTEIFAHATELSGSAPTTKPRACWP
jgi:hypothetical protein